MVISGYVNSKLVLRFCFPFHVLGSLNLCVSQRLMDTNLAINLIVGHITCHMHVKLVCVLNPNNLN